MSRSSKSIMQVALALTLALVAGLLVFRWMSVNQARANTNTHVATVDVVVAAADLATGTQLAPEHLRTAPYMAASVPPQAFNKVEPLVGRILAQPLAANEPVTGLRLMDENARISGVSAKIAPGQRAMTVRGNEVMGLAGFIRPGDRVDVLVTLMTGQHQDKAITKVVIENALVLATGKEFEPAPDGGQPMPVDTYTLALSPEESETLALAASQGSLNFALRNHEDDEIVLTTGADVSTTLSAHRLGSQKSPSLSPSKGKSATVVEVINGSDRQKVTF